MVRKHNAWTKARARYRRHRPKTPAPKNGWLLAELAQLTGLTATTIRYYVQQRLIRPIERRGTATRYERRELLRLLGLTRLKFEGKSTLAEKKRKLEAMGDEKMEEWLRSGPLPLAAASALGFDAATANETSAVVQGPLDQQVGGIEHWQRITLLPGLELMLRADARPPARLAAQRIIDEYVVAPLRVT
jgi:DNA-binding transcriptional MerR regulator